MLELAATHPAISDASNAFFSWFGMFIIPALGCCASFYFAVDKSYWRVGDEKATFGERFLWVAGVVLAIATLFTVSAAFIMVRVASDKLNADAALSIVRHDVQIEKWLQSDYGIIVSQSAAHDLAAGKSLVVTRNGADILIELTPRADKGLAVRVPAGALLQPGVTK